MEAWKGKGTDSQSYISEESQQTSHLTNQRCMCCTCLPPLQLDTVSLVDKCKVRGGALAWSSSLLQLPNQTSSSASTPSIQPSGYRFHVPLSILVHATKPSWEGSSAAPSCTHKIF